MRIPPLPPNENAREAALRRAPLREGETDEGLDRITRIARHLFRVPIALFSVVEGDRQWFKSRQGLEAQETPRDISFCGHAILQEEVFCIEDAWEDERFADNPLVVDAPYVRFYAGCPIRSPDGHILGTLCIIDHRARAMSAQERALLSDLARILERELLRATGQPEP